MLDLIGRNFEGLKVLKRGLRPGGYWVCRCLCGKSCSVRAYHLINGQKSCGCLQNKPRHGQSGTKIYNVWKSMRQRCFNPKNKDFKYYGGQGVKVCYRWGTFDLFFEDMGVGWFEGATIERLNPKKSYSPSNCCWIPRSQQNKNKRKTYRIKIGGVEKPLVDWCEELQLNADTIRKRIRCGWSIDRALKQEVRAWRCLK